MAVSCSFFLTYSEKKINEMRLDDQFVGIRCQVRYTRDSLPWSVSRRLGHEIHRLQFMLDVKAQPKYWASGRVKHQAGNSRAVNGRIDEIGTRIHQLHAQYVASGLFPTPSDFIMEIFGQVQATQKSSLLADYEKYLAYCQHRTSEAFLYNQQLTLRRLKEFLGKYGAIQYENINKTWAQDFTAWILRPAAGREKTAKTAMKHLKLIKMFMNHALLEGWTSAAFFKQIKIIEKRDPFPISLTADEVRRLILVSDSDLPDAPPKQRRQILTSRDWFVLATQTALRYSDWDSDRLNIVQSGAGKNIQVIQKKPGLPVEIPVSDIAEKVLERNGYKLPKPSVPSATMRHIAAACKAAGITKHITTHTARRTFATLQEAAGVPRSVIMRITGHKTEKDYLKYVGITFEHNADLLRSANPEMFRAG